MFGDAGDNIVEIGFRIKVVHFSSFDDGVHDGGAITAGVGR